MNKIKVTDANQFHGQNSNGVYQIPSVDKYYTESEGLSELCIIETIFIAAMCLARYNGASAITFNKSLYPAVWYWTSNESAAKRQRTHCETDRWQVMVGSACIKPKFLYQTSSDLGFDVSCDETRSCIEVLLLR